MNSQKLFAEIVLKERAELKNGKIIDRKVSIIENHTAERSSSLLTWLKEICKKCPKFYYALVYIISPTFVNLKPLKLFLNSCQNKIILNIGSGNQRLGKEIINIDLFNYPHVDIVTNVIDCCLKNNSVERIVNIANLEHLEDPEKHIKEILRILKPGGECFYSVPFIYGYHASPNDYTRWTHAGLQKLFERSGFKVIKVETLSGPASSFLQISIDFFAILFSFGSNKIYEILTILLMLIFWPIKFLDLLLIHIPFSNHIAANFYLIAQKPPTIKDDK